MKIQCELHKWTYTFISSKVSIGKFKHKHVANGWKGLDIRNKSYVEQKSIWSLENYENWL
jgi:hypothetical protein